MRHVRLAAALSTVVLAAVTPSLAVAWAASDIPVAAPQPDVSGRAGFGGNSRSGTGRVPQPVKPPKTEAPIPRKTEAPATGGVTQPVPATTRASTSRAPAPSRSRTPEPILPSLLQSLEPEPDPSVEPSGEADAAG